MVLEIIDKNSENENFYKRHKRDFILSELFEESNEIESKKYYSDFYLTFENDPSALITSIDFSDKSIKVIILSTYTGKIVRELIEDGFTIKIDLNKRIILI